MKYSINDLELIRSIDVIRSNRSAFLPFGAVSGLSIAWGILQRAVDQEHGAALVDRREDWWLIVLQRDLLANANEVELRRRFEEIVASPESGQNTCHPEVVVGAFASDIAIITRSAELRVKGAHPLAEEVRGLLQASTCWQTVLAFRLNALPPSK